MAGFGKKKRIIRTDLPGATEAVAITDILSARIAQGHYLAGDPLPSERALATEFAVDRSVVRISISQLERRRLVYRNRGCRPRVGQPVGTELPGQPVRSKSRRNEIAVLLSYNTTYPAAINISQGINEFLRFKEAPFRAHVFDTCGLTLETQALDALEADKFAGIVVWHSGDSGTLARLARLHDKGAPLVFVDRYTPDIDCDFVGTDNQGSAFDAVKYLIDLGHRRIAHLTSDESVSSVVLRSQGYREALFAEGISFDPSLVLQPDLWDVADAVASLLNLPEPPTAIFAMNDAYAHAIITAVEAMGLQVPGDISVMGFDDLERYSPRPALLTTVHQPFCRIGQRAADLLIQRLSTRSRTMTYRHILLHAPVVVRSTCRQINGAS